jgi:hypothetical protein
MVIEMAHNERIPNTRFGAGLVTKLENRDALVLPVRDSGAPSQPKRLDGQMGIKEKDESVWGAQSREGTEETVVIRRKDGKVEIGVPETIKDTELEENLVNTYEEALRDAESPLPEADGKFYYEASQEVGEGMPSTEVESGGYETGYTWEISDDVSMELMNDHIVDLDYDEIVNGDLEIYDLESMETDEGVMHFNRPTAILEPTRDQITVFRGGEIKYRGEVEGFRDFLSEEYGWDMEDVDTPATAKVQARLDAYGEELGDQTSDEFVNEQYMEALSDIGEAFDSFPSP